jgi:hypothetical protein
MNEYGIAFLSVFSLQAIPGVTSPDLSINAGALASTNKIAALSRAREAVLHVPAKHSNSPIRRTALTNLLHIGIAILVCLQSQVTYLQFPH